MCAQSFPRFSCSVLSVTLFTKIIHSDIVLSLTSLCGLLLPLCICHLSQIQIVATCLDARNVPSLPGIPPREVESAWKHVKDMLVELIDETRAKDESIFTTSPMMANRVTGLLQHLRHLLALSTNRVQTLPMRRSPYGGCAYKNCRHTRTL